MKKELSVYLNSVYGEGEWIKNYSNNQLFLNHSLISKSNINLEAIQRRCSEVLWDGQGELQEERSLFS